MKLIKTLVKTRYIRDEFTCGISAIAESIQTLVVKNALHGDVQPNKDRIPTGHAYLISCVRVAINISLSAGSYIAANLIEAKSSPHNNCLLGQGGDAGI